MSDVSCCDEFMAYITALTNIRIYWTGFWRQWSWRN